MSMPGLDIPEFRPLQTLPAGRLQNLGSLVTPYEATLTGSTTDPNLGAGGFANGWWTQRGPWVDVVVWIQFGTSGTSNGIGNYAIALPPEAPINGLYGPRQALGQITLRDADVGINAGTRFATAITPVTGNSSIDMRLIESTQSPLVSSTTPWTWTNDDHMLGQFSYLFDPQ